MIGFGTPVDAKYEPDRGDGGGVRGGGEDVSSCCLHGFCIIVNLVPQTVQTKSICINFFDNEIA